MKKNGIYNVKLAKAVAKMGHGDIILIGDVGCPFPRHNMTTAVDLAVCEGVPKVSEVMKAVLKELVVESYIVTDETKRISPQVYEELKEILDKEKNKGNDLMEKTIPHEEMKDLWLNGSLKGEEVKVFVRTGERCPYCYVALVAGVDF
ncbi:MAG: D-ribose pyranase [Clostridiales bacterium]|nr:D-ribose pyranase [Clostridiales bacterium]